MAVMKLQSLLSLEWGRTYCMWEVKGLAQEFYTQPSGHTEGKRKTFWNVKMYTTIILLVTNVVCRYTHNEYLIKINYLWQRNNNLKTNIGEYRSQVINL